MNTNARFTHLLNNYLANTSLPLEKDELFEMLSDPDYKDTLNQKMQESWNLPSADVASSLLSSTDLYRKINERKSAHFNVSKSTKTNWKWYWAAASFIFFASLVLLFFLSRETEQVNQKDFTSFNIRSFEEEPEVKVTLRTGKVGLGKENLAFAYLLPIQQLSYQKNVADFSFNEVAEASLASWKEGNLVFENITFGEAAVTLQKSFGVEFLFNNDTLKRCRFTANFDLEEDLDQVLKASTKLNGISSREENNNIYFI